MGWRFCWNSLLHPQYKARQRRILFGTAHPGAASIQTKTRTIWKHPPSAHAAINRPPNLRGRPQPCFPFLLMLLPCIVTPVSGRSEHPTRQYQRQDGQAVRSRPEQTRRSDRPESSHHVTGSRTVCAPRDRHGVGRVELAMHRPMSYSVEPGNSPDQDPGHGPHQIILMVPRRPHMLRAHPGALHLSPAFHLQLSLSQTCTLGLFGVTRLFQHDSRLEKEHWAQRVPIIGMIQG